MFDGADDADGTAGWRDEAAAYTCTPSGAGWREVDRRLRGIAKQRGALDADEARWLRAAERVQIWRPLGMVNMTDYMERILGYAPRNAQKRLQVARALEVLPALTDALATGALPFSAVRELVRVATPTTEAAWLSHVEHMNVRQIEEAVAGHRPGDLPTDAPDDDAREHEITLRVNAAAYATWRQGRTQLDEEHDHRLDDSELVMAMFAVPRHEASGEISGRAKFQIALRLCPRCAHGVQEGAGVGVHVDAATVARARCDAQHLGDLAGDEPARAHQDVAPSVVRFVFRRDQGRCRAPGCRSSRALEIHHIEHREHGGSHEPRNLCLLCSSCHAAHHRGDLAISGTADALVVTRPQLERLRTKVPVSPAPPTRDIAPGGLDVLDAGTSHGLPTRDLTPAEPDVLDAVTSRGLPTRDIAPGGLDVLDAGTSHGLSTRDIAPGGLDVLDAGTSHGLPTRDLTSAEPNVLDAGTSHGLSTRDIAPGGLDVLDAGTSRGLSTRDLTPAEPNVLDTDSARGGLTASRFAQIAARTQARAALVTMGWKASIARTAVDQAQAQLPTDATLEALIRAALQRCPLAAG